MTMALFKLIQPSLGFCSIITCYGWVTGSDRWRACPILALFKCDWEREQTVGSQRKLPRVQTWAHWARWSKFDSIMRSQHLHAFLLVHRSSLSCTGSSPWNRKKWSTWIYFLLQKHIKTLSICYYNTGALYFREVFLAFEDSWSTSRCAPTLWNIEVSQTVITVRIKFHVA